MLKIILIVLCWLGGSVVLALLVGLVTLYFDEEEDVDL
jgi:hypothetical protein